jgi:hypothetical protein
MIGEASRCGAWRHRLVGVTRHPAGGCCRGTAVTEEEPRNPCSTAAIQHARQAALLFFDGLLVTITFLEWWLLGHFIRRWWRAFR